MLRGVAVEVGGVVELEASGSAKIRVMGMAHHLNSLTKSEHERMQSK